MGEDHIAIQLAEKISEIYSSNVYGELEEISNNIKKELEEILYSYQNNYNLCFNNKKYYSIEHRLKDKDSLYEKLHRKNIVFDLIKELDITSIEHIEKETLVEKIKLFPDNIGFRIVCDLQGDVNEVNILLNEKKNDFKIISFKNISSQPVTMANGHKIYKIDCLYNNQIPFELQIKNKFDSVWGDIEHSLYYKNNKINIVKSVNRVSFDHVANMLRELDKYMHEIRQMNMNLIANGNHVNDIMILSKISEQYENPLKDLISSKYSFDFSSIGEELIFMFNKNSIENICMDNLKNNFNNLLEKKSKRHNSWKMIILELIYINTYKCDHNKFIEEYEQFIHYKLDLKDGQEELKRFISLTYNEAILNKDGSEHLKDLNKYINLKKLGFEIIDAMSSLEIESEDNIFKYFGFKYFELCTDSLLIEDIKSDINEIENYIIEDSNFDDEIKLKLGLK